MRKVWLCVFYAVCIFTIVFSLFWMARTIMYYYGCGRTRPQQKEQRTAPFGGALMRKLR